MLTPKQERAVAALLAEPTLERAAASAGVSESQLRAWLEQGRFHEAYRRGRQDVFSRAYWMAQRYAPHAVQTLAKIMSDDHAQAAQRIAAAMAILRVAREGMDLEDELADPAARLALVDPGHGGNPPARESV